MNIAGNVTVLNTPGGASFQGFLSVGSANANDYVLLPSTRQAETGIAARAAENGLITTVDRELNGAHGGYGLSLESAVTLLRPGTKAGGGGGALAAFGAGGAGGGSCVVLATGAVLITGSVTAVGDAGGGSGGGGGGGGVVVVGSNAAITVTGTGRITCDGGAGTSSNISVAPSGGAEAGSFICSLPATVSLQERCR